jgi:PPK2 family polyphosphate:nucleotide phosphotransferase
MPERWAIKPGTKVDLSAIDPASTDGAPGDRRTTEATIPELHNQLLGLQDRLWAEAKRSLLVVLQALDAGGKDGTIKHVFGGVNPQATHVTAFKVPTAQELAHDFLWRVHAAVPAAGQIGIFNRSHYEDVLAVRVHQLVPEDVWRGRYRIINDFEHALTAGGTTIVKLFLHISKDEQRERLQERLDNPTKRWKFRPSDVEERAHWDDYMRAYADALERTSTKEARWYVIPADHKWMRNWAVSRVLIETLTRMDPHYPKPEGLGNITIQ